jgi:hypothetical protein
MNPGRAIASGAVVLGLAGLGGAGVSSAMGQTQGTATWLWSVWDVGEHADGDLIIEPGEDVAVGLWLDFSPDVDGPGGPVIGFAAVWWDTLGGLNADTGWISEWQRNPKLNFFDDTTTTDGVSLFDSSAMQWITWPFFDYSDPIWIMDFIWRTRDATPRTVEYATESLGSMMGMWIEDAPGNTENWGVIEAHISWQVVPSVGILPILAVAAVGLGIRRSRS